MNCINNNKSIFFANNNMNHLLKKSSLLKILKQISVEFCCNSTIHGLFYIVEPGRRLVERIFWSVMVIVALVAALVVADHALKKPSSQYSRSYLKSLHYPTYMAARPAFTFCTSTLQRSRAVGLMNSMTIPNDINRTEIMADLSFLHLLVDSRGMGADDINLIRLQRLQNLLNNNSVSVEEAIKQLVQPCSELFVHCFVGSMITNCSKLVFSTRTDVGFCCSLHYIPPPDIHVGSNFNTMEKLDNSSFLNYGFESGHAFVLNISSTDSLKSRVPSLGAQVYVHSKTQYPQLFVAGTAFSIGWETFIRLRISLRRVLPALKSVSPDTRKCYFADELKLKYFSFYSFSNCITEARMDFIFKKCDCLPISFPNQGQFKTCTLMDLKCLIKYQFSDKYGYNSGMYVLLDRVKHFCYSKCSKTDYILHATNGDFNVPHINAFRLYNGINTTGLTVVHIFRDSPTVWLYFRDTIMYPWDLISVCGGALGIFAGMHFFNIIEFFYYYFIRLSLSVLNYVKEPKCINVKT